MRIKVDFITNSSSSSFMIQNLTNQMRCLVDLVTENSNFLKNFLEDYPWYKKSRYTQKKLLESARKNRILWKPNESKVCIFGNEDGTLVGLILESALQRNGKCESFRWKFIENLR